MGIIARILEFTRGGRNGAKIPQIKVDVGGGENKTVDIYNSPGEDSPPLSTDYAAATNTLETGGIAGVGFLDPLNEGIAVPGEKRIYSRDASGNIVATIYLKADGSILLENANGSIELAADGRVLINGVDFAQHMHVAGALLDSLAAPVTGNTGAVV